MCQLSGASSYIFTDNAQLLLLYDDSVKKCIPVTALFSLHFVTHFLFVFFCFAQQLVDYKVEFVTRLIFPTS